MGVQFYCTLLSYNCAMHIISRNSVPRFNKAATSLETICHVTFGHSII